MKFYQMKKIILLIILSIVLISCKQAEKKEDIYKNYPKNLAKVLKKHGGLDNWNSLQVLFLYNAICISR